MGSAAAWYEPNPVLPDALLTKDYREGAQPNLGSLTEPDWVPFSAPRTAELIAAQCCARHHFHLARCREASLAQPGPGPQSGL